MNGATQVLNSVHDEGVVSFYLMPPSIDDLRKRIEGRKTESQEIIAQRVEKGMNEIKEASKYDYVIINDEVEKAGEKIIKIIQEKLA